MFIDLSISRIDGKPNKNLIQSCIDHLKELLPQDHLMKLLSLKDRVFWDFAAEVFCFFIRLCLCCASVTIVVFCSYC
jgi:hypothetical protein